MVEPDVAPTELRLFVDEPKAESLIGGRILVRGWVARRGGGAVAGVDVRLGGRSIRIPVGLHRPDVAAALEEPAAEWSGFEGWIVADESETGETTELIFAAADDRGGTAEQRVRIRVLPPGWSVIEVERCDRSGDRIEIEGWLLWLDGEPPARIAVFCGEDLLGRALANHSRPDIARGFPDAPPGACRGFRVTVWVASADAAGEPLGLRVVATDARGRRLEQSTRAAADASSASNRDGRERLFRVDPVLGRLREATGRELSVLDWQSGLGIDSLPSSWIVFAPPSEGGSALPYVDGSIDVVVVSAADPERLAEARRVARLATIEDGSLHRMRETGGQPRGAETSVLVYADRGTERIEETLTALTETLPASLRGEILFLDDATEEDVSGPIRRWVSSRAGARVVRNDSPRGYGRSANRGAGLASGDLIVFLGADVVPRDAWLMPLLEPLRRDLSVAAVGGCLITADGRPGRAESIGDETEARGRSAQPVRRNLLRTGVLRDVAAGPASFLAVRRSSFLEVGGFPAGTEFDEDPATDLCGRLRAGSSRILSQPAAVADLRAGVVATPLRASRRVGGSMIERLVRWRKAGGAAGSRRRVLVAAPRMPEFDREAGSRRIFHFIELLCESGWEVGFLALESKDGERYVQLLRERGVAVYAGPESMGARDEYLESLDELFAEESFDLAIVAFWRVAERLLPLIRDRSPRTRVIVDSIDLHYLREERAALGRADAGESPENRDRRLARRERELAAYAAADAVLTVSEREARLVEEVTGGRARAFCVPIPESLERSRVGLPDRSDLLFMGNFRHRPNLEGLEFLCRAVLPRLGDELLGRFPLAVVGNEVDNRVRALAAEVPHARVVGWVPSVVPYLEAARVSLVSLLSGAGTKGKLVQALMVGTPSVATSIGVEGLDLEPGRHVLVADTAETFADAIRRLETDPVLWTKLAREGREHILRSHGRESVGRQLLEAIETTLAARRGWFVRSAAG